MVRKRRVNPERFDRDWFAARIRELRDQDSTFTQRKIAKTLGMPFASMTRTLQGTRRLSMEEAADLARILGQPHDEVMRRAGVNVPLGEQSNRKPGATTAPVVGRVALDGLVERGSFGVVPLPGDMPAGVVALKLEATGHPLNGWLFFHETSASVEAEAVGRLSVSMTSAGKQYVRALARGAARGSWQLGNLWGVGEVVESSLKWATPVLGIRC